MVSFAHACQLVSESMRMLGGDEPDQRRRLARALSHLIPHDSRPFPEGRAGVILARIASRLDNSSGFEEQLRCMAQLDFHLIIDDFHALYQEVVSTAARNASQ